MYLAKKNPLVNDRGGGYFAPSAIAPDVGYICGHIKDNVSFTSCDGWEDVIKAYKNAVELLKE